MVDRVLKQNTYGAQSSPIQTSSIPEAVVQRIVQMIGDGIWRAGDQLPPQRQLAQDLGVSMASLREALHTLQGMGVLELRHGQGTFVCHDPSKIVERCLNLALLLDREMVKDFLDARRAIEGGLAYLAAQRAGPEQVARLGKLVDGMRIAVDARDDPGFEELDVTFHKLVSEMSDSSILHYLGSTLFDTLEQFIRAVPHTPQGYQSHAEVWAAIQDQDPARSQEAMQSLIDASATYIQFLHSDNGKE
jgi:GntR family transcriptional repressor for pyruvate dehydrogenase complex